MVVLSNKIYITGDDYEKYQYLKEKLIGKNPAHLYWQSMVASKPYLRKSLAEPPPELTLYEDDGKTLTVPRGMLKEISSYTNLTSAPVGELGRKAISLRTEQSLAQEEILKSPYGILEAATGAGKTVLGLSIAQSLGLKTLFLVHTKSLLKQTCAEVKAKLGIEPGIIGDGKTDIKDFTVATIQSLIRKDLTLWKAKFGLVILDEAHHCPSSTFLKVMGAFEASRVYGLTATVNRTDKLEWAMYASIGPILHTVDKAKLIEAKNVVKPTVYAVETPYVPKKNFALTDLSLHLNDIARSKERNEFLISDITGKIKTNSYAIVVTDRVAHVEYFAEKLKQFNPVVFHGQLKTKEAEEALSKIKNSQPQLTIATYGSIGEGFDVPIWDTLFLTTPFSSPVRLIQVLGRISRSALGKNSAVVYDYVDSNDEVLLSKYTKRASLYRQHCHIGKLI